MRVPRKAESERDVVVAIIKERRSELTVGPFAFRPFFALALYPKAFREKPESQIFPKRLQRSYVARRFDLTLHQV